MPLTNHQLGRMRALRERLMTDTATVQRKTVLPDGYGGLTETYATTTTYPCWVKPAGSAPEAARLGKVVNELGWTVGMPWDADVLPSDRILIGTRVLEIQGVMTGKTYQSALEVQCKEIPSQ